MSDNQGLQQEFGLTRTAEIDGWRVQWKNNGIDYPTILEAYKKGQLNVQHLSSARNCKEVDLIEFEGRRYIIKRDWYVEKRLEKRLAYFIMRETKYNRIFNFINKAVHRGCQIVYDVVLVAEKLTGPTTCLEAYLLAEYIEGKPLSVPEFMDRLDEVSDMVLQMHDYGLASGDIHSYNFILTPENSLKVIDMNINFWLIFYQIMDIRVMKYWYNTDIPLRGVLQRLVWGIFLLGDGIRYCWAKVCRKPMKRWK